MKLDITEEEYVERIKAYYVVISGAEHVSQTAIQALKDLGVTFKQEIDWDAETHDPRVIPDKWLVECWDNGELCRLFGLLDKENNYAYDNYRAIKKEYWPKWAIEAHKSLEG